MPAAILGRKLGMTRYFKDDGTNVPATILDVGPCIVTQVKTSESDGYAAVQLAYDDIKPRRSTMPLIGHDHKAGTAPKRVHREVRLDDDKAAGEYELGQTVDLSSFEDVLFVDVVGTGIGKGFQGVMKRYGFKGMPASHGTKRCHRHTGSINGHATNLGRGPKLKKGKRMCGHMGAKRITERSLEILATDPEKNLMIVKGPVPGPARGLLFISQAKRLHRSKAKFAKANG